MEVNIQELVSSIRKDGIETARKEADAIICEAGKQAEQIISDAKLKADEIKLQSQNEIETFRKSAIMNVEQAKRDALLSFKSEVQEAYKKILENDICTAMDDKAIVTLIKALVCDEDVSKYSVELKAVSDNLKRELSEAVKNGLEIKTSKNAKSGFRLSLKDGSGYFDCSDEEISCMLLPFLKDIKL